MKINTVWDLVNNKKIPNYLSILIPLIYIIGFIFIVIRYSPNFPNGDDYLQIVNFLNQFLRAEKLSDKANLFFYDIAVHPHFTTKLSAILNYTISGTLSLKAMIIQGALAVPLLYLLLLRSFSEKCVLDFAQKTTISLIITLLLFQPQYAEAILWASASQTFVWSYTLPLAALLCANKSGVKRTLAAGLFCLLSSVTMANGILVSWVLLAYMLLLKRWKEAALWLFMAIIVAVGYFSIRSNNLSSHLSLNLRSMEYSLQLLGSVIGYYREDFSTYVGITIVSLLVVILVKGGFKKFPTATIFTGYVILSIFLTAIGRANNFPYSSYSISRYTLLSVLVIIYVLVAFPSVLNQKLGKKIGIVSVVLAMFLNIILFYKFSPQIFVRSQLMQRDRLLWELTKVLDKSPLTPYFQILSVGQKKFSIDLGASNLIESTSDKISCESLDKYSGMKKLDYIKEYRFINDKHIFYSGWFRTSLERFTPFFDVYAKLKSNKRELCVKTKVIYRTDVTGYFRVTVKNYKSNGFGVNILIDNSHYKLDSIDSISLLLHQK